MEKIYCKIPQFEYRYRGRNCDKSTKKQLMNDIYIHKS